MATTYSKVRENLALTLIHNLVSYYPVIQIATAGSNVTEDEQTFVYHFMNKLTTISSSYKFPLTNKFALLLSIIRLSNFLLLLSLLGCPNKKPPSRNVAFSALSYYIITLFVLPFCTPFTL